MVKTTMEKYGRIDILINNAGITQDALIAKMTGATPMRADELDKLSQIIDQMETKEQAKVISEKIDSMGSHSCIVQANVNDYKHA